MNHRLASALAAIVIGVIAASIGLFGVAALSGDLSDSYECRTTKPGSAARCF